MQPAATDPARKLRLTDDGAALLLNACARRWPDRAGHRRDPGEETDINGLIRLAAPIALSNTILVDMLADFGLRYPGVQFDIRQANDHAPHCDQDQGPGLLQRRALPDPCPMPSAWATSEYGLFASPLYLGEEGGALPSDPAGRARPSFTAGPISTGS